MAHQYERSLMTMTGDYGSSGPLPSGSGMLPPVWLLRSDGNIIAVANGSGSMADFAAVDP